MTGPRKMTEQELKDTIDLSEKDFIDFLYKWKFAIVPPYNSVGYQFGRFVLGVGMDKIAHMSNFAQLYELFASYPEPDDITILQYKQKLQKALEKWGRGIITESDGQFGKQSIRYYESLHKSAMKLDNQELSDYIVKWKLKYG